MAMIRQKKKNLILSMILGMIVTAIPLGIYGGTMTYKKTDAEKRHRHSKHRWQEKRNIRHTA